MSQYVSIFLAMVACSIAAYAVLSVRQSKSGPIIEAISKMASEGDRRFNELRQQLSAIVTPIAAPPPELASSPHAFLNPGGLQGALAASLLGAAPPAPPEPDIGSLRSLFAGLEETVFAHRREIDSLIQGLRSDIHHLANAFNAHDDKLSVMEGVEQQTRDIAERSSRDLGHSFTALARRVDELEGRADHFDGELDQFDDDLKAVENKIKVRRPRVATDDVSETAGHDGEKRA